MIGLHTSSPAIREIAHTVVDLTIVAAMVTELSHSSQHWSPLERQPPKLQHRHVLLRVLQARRQKLRSARVLGYR